MNAHYKTISSSYTELLMQDTKDYEEKTRKDRLKRLDKLVVDTATLELTARGTEQAAEVLHVFKCLDKYLADYGFTGFQTAERLQKAYAFFDSDPSQLADYLEMYLGARDEVWTEIG